MSNSNWLLGNLLDENTTTQLNSRIIYTQLQESSLSFKIRSPLADGTTLFCKAFTIVPKIKIKSDEFFIRAHAAAQRVIFPTAPEDVEQ